jgi:hypothetical protein
VNHQQFLQGWHHFALHTLQSAPLNLFFQDLIHRYLWTRFCNLVEIRLLKNFFVCSVSPWIKWHRVQLCSFYLHVNTSICFFSLWYHKLILPLISSIPVLCVTDWECMTARDKRVREGNAILLLLLLEFPPICFGAPSISNRGILRFPYIFTGNWFKR